MFDYQTPPPWTKGALKRLGIALAAEAPEPPDGPSYADVLDWHNDLCTSVMSTIVEHDWSAVDTSTRTFDVTARPKTLDTLVQKMVRQPNITLDQVQDLSGVRVDVDCTLKEQSALSHEIATIFGADPDRAVKDIRTEPHSGYRAVHVWLRLPAGRVEVQLRTVSQSVWANTYERLGDLAGRGIRYGEESSEPWVAALVKMLHTISETIQETETIEQEIADLRPLIEGVQGRLPQLRRARWYSPTARAALRTHEETLEVQGSNEARIATAQATLREQLHAVRAMLDDVQRSY